MPDRFDRRRVYERAPLGPAIALGLCTAILVFTALLAATSWGRSRGALPTSPEPLAGVSREVDLWVGEIVPGVKAILASEWNQPDWDARHDATLNDGLRLVGNDRLAYYQLLLCNTTEAEVTVPVRDGALSLVRRDGSQLPMVSLAPRLAGAGGGAVASSPQVSTLRALGGHLAEVSLPPGRMTRHPVAFAYRVALGELASVASADGTPFRARRILEPVWAGLLHSPRTSDLRDL